MTTIPVIVLAFTTTVITVSGQAEFKITTKKKGDVAGVQFTKDKTTVFVKSPTGIGHGVIERQTEIWPKVVVIRLDLKGLENFRVSNGKVRLDAAVSSQTGKVQVWKGGKEGVQQG